LRFLVLRVAGDIASRLSHVLRARTSNEWTRCSPSPPYPSPRDSPIVDGMTNTAEQGSVPTVTKYDYPLSTERPELLFTKRETNKDERRKDANRKIEYGKFIDITMNNVDKLEPDDLRIHPRTLFLQAQIADDCGRPQLAENLRRAAELADIDDTGCIIKFYDAMRPSQTNKRKMNDAANELERRGATRCASLIREAVVEYERQKLFKEHGCQELLPTAE
jgi:propanediol dehydratase small subunit